MQRHGSACESKNREPPAAQRNPGISCLGLRGPQTCQLNAFTLSALAAFPQCECVCVCACMAVCVCVCMKVDIMNLKVVHKKATAAAWILL